MADSANTEISDSPGRSFKLVDGLMRKLQIPMSASLSGSGINL
jgi:hypothetical protein